MLHIALLLFSCVCITGTLYGQVKFYTQLSESTVSPKQTFQVQYIIEGSKDIGHFELPDFPHFRVVLVFDNPVTTTINQKTGDTVDTYSKNVILLPRRTGRIAIPGATAQIDGKPVKSNAVTVNVQQTGLSSLPSDYDIDTESESELYTGDDIGERIKKNFFILIEASKKQCYVGEPLMVVYKVYSRLNTNSQVVKRPSLTGFSVLEMVDSYDGKAEVEMLNGLPYYTSIIRKVQLFPLQEGNYVLDAAEIESVVHFVVINKPRSSDKDGFRDMFGRKEGSNYMQRSVLNYRTTVRSEPMTITVKPLPASGQPAGFAGAVGNFSLELETPAGPIREGDLVKIRLVVNGSGNISLLTAPSIEWPAGVDTADPVVRETINKFVYPATGRKTFEYSFAAPDTGDYIIPAARLPYYDPVQKTYKIATSDPVTLHVMPGIKTDAGQLARLRQHNDPLLRHWYWFALVAVIIVSWIGWQAFQLSRTKPAAAQAAAGLEATPTPVPEPPTTEEVLYKAQRAMEPGNPLVFYRALEQCLWEVVAAKYHVLPSALNKQNVLQLLHKNGVPDAVIAGFSNLMQELEWALYTPDQSAHDMNKLFEKAREVVSNLV